MWKNFLTLLLCASCVSIAAAAPECADGSCSSDKDAATLLQTKVVTTVASSGDHASVDSDAALKSMISTRMEENWFICLNEFLDKMCKCLGENAGCRQIKTGKCGKADVDACKPQMDKCLDANIFTGKYWYAGWCASACRDRFENAARDCVKDLSHAEMVKHGTLISLKGGKDGRYCQDNWWYGGRVSCNSNSVGSWEKFTVHAMGTGKMALRSGRSGKYCADEHNQVKCDRNHAGSWETFTVVNAGGGKAALKGGKDHRYCADEHNSIKCNRGGIGGWEKFTVGCRGNCGSLLQVISESDQLIQEGDREVVVARSIADANGSTEHSAEHLDEALSGKRTAC